MLGILLAMHALLVAEESVRQPATEPWNLETNASRNTSLAFLATHELALSRVVAGARAQDALRNTRRAAAVGIQICADTTRMLTILGPVGAADAPEILDVILSAGTPAVQAAGYAGDSALPPDENVPTGCFVPSAHVWVGAKVN